MYGSPFVDSPRVSTSTRGDTLARSSKYATIVFQSGIHPASPGVCPSARDGDGTLEDAVRASRRRRRNGRVAICSRAATIQSSSNNSTPLSDVRVGGGRVPSAIRALIK